MIYCSLMFITNSSTEENFKPLLKSKRTLKSSTTPLPKPEKQQLKLPAISANKGKNFRTIEIFEDIESTTSYLLLVC